MPQFPPACLIKNKQKPFQIQKFKILYFFKYIFFGIRDGATRQAIKFLCREAPVFYYYFRNIIVNSVSIYDNRNYD